jgi:hypothetical protein
MDYNPERAGAEIVEVEADMRRRLAETLDMVAKFDEQVPDRDVFGLSSGGGRKPSNAVERELTVALNTVGQFLNERARAECPRAGWDGLADAATLIFNEIGRRHVGVLSSRALASRVRDHRSAAGGGASGLRGR